MSGPIPPTTTADTVPAYVTAILRWAGGIAVGYLVKLGVEGEAVAWVPVAVVGLGTLLWSLWQKHQMGLRLVEAQKSRDPAEMVRKVPM